MRTKRWWWGMLCVAGMACADEPVVGTGPDPARVSGDLEFVLPAVRGAPAVVRRVEIDSARTLRPAVTTDPMTANVGTGGQIAFITQHYLTARFEGALLITDYGVHGWGTGWTVKPTINITAADGRSLASNAGIGAAGDFLVPSYVGGDYSESIGVEGLCGAYSTVQGYFEVRLSVPIGRWPITKDSRPGSAATYQPGCSSGTSTTGGNSTPSGGVRYTICYYEVWIDLDGNVVDVVPLGCYSVGAYAQ